MKRKKQRRQTLRPEALLASEELKALVIRLNLLLKPRGSGQAILLTALQPGEGTTTATFALARAFSDQGRRLAVLTSTSADHALLGTLQGDGGPGAVTVLPADDFLRPDLFETDNLLDGGEGFDLLLVDAPPVGHVFTRHFAGRVNGVILVADTQCCRRQAVIQAATQLQSGGARFLGVLLNRFSSPLPAAFRRWMHVA